MIYIFGQLSSTERRNVMTVCRHWMEIVEKYFKDNCIVLKSGYNLMRGGRLFKTFSATKRTFPYLAIESFPTKLITANRLPTFIELIGDGVKFFKIIENFWEIDWMFEPVETSKNWFTENLFCKMPNLQGLEVASHDFLGDGDLTFLRNLQEIKIGYKIHDLKQLNALQKIQNVKKLTSPAIKLYNKQYESFVSFMEPHFQELVKEILGDDPNTSIVMYASSYNYCGNLAMSPRHVTGMRVEGGFQSFTPDIVRQFSNLKVGQT